MRLDELREPILLRGGLMDGKTIPCLRGIPIDIPYEVPDLGVVFLTYKPTRRICGGKRVYYYSTFRTIPTDDELDELEEAIENET